MMDRDFMPMLRTRQGNIGQLCVGLDPVRKKMPPHLFERFSVEEALFQFCIRIVDAVQDLVCAFKPNIAFFSAFGLGGMAALSRVVAYIHEKYSEIPVILDAKRGDIGKTNVGYVIEGHEIVGADAITLHPWLGRESLKPFLDVPNKGCIILCKTSNPGAGEFQDLLVGDDKTPLHRVVARNVANDWNENGNCALVVGATYPDDLAQVRKIVGDEMEILMPGLGKQKADAAAALKASGRSVIGNSSSGVIFASQGENFDGAARHKAQELRGQILEFLPLAA